METCVRGDRAREITDLLSFDGAIHTDTIGYAGGLWVLWNADRVDIALLSSTEQEIHVEVKVIAGDFNEPLFSEDKFGGRSLEDELLKELDLMLNQVDELWALKSRGPETLGNYRPVSLCNTVYKVVTKIIVARLRPYLDKLISPMQTAFVPGRKWNDNVIIAQEIIHSFRKKKGRTRYMAFKIDLEKAYDKLKWNFIRDILIRVNLPIDIIDVTMSCVSTVSTSILFNGETLDPIFPSRDDLILFAKADGVNCAAIRDVLDTFCSIFGQTVSEAKSRVYFSPNVDRDTRELLCDTLGFASMSFLGKYLGFPLKQPSSSSHDYNFILDRVKQKLSGWKANLLSLASRSVLIQSSLVAIPLYIMQCSYLPSRVLDGLYRVNRNFLWGSTESAKKAHWVG
ncbi:hypothetical protein SO802_011525 [Lithocarpus litseifolius]|uniref:Reverse transcriptase domain-containing protein n=1 Tax=Lithocarpus litseifolius TaxID=425828 RepID=A0AAW2D1K4_9ROSI